MFNNNNQISNNTNIKINACSGGIYKAYKESFFKRFALRSDFAGCVLCDNPTMLINGVKKSVIIIQMIMCGDMDVIAEIITKDDFEKYFETSNE